MTPVYKSDEADFNGYLPNANWNEFPSGRNLRNFNSEKSEGSEFSFSGKFDNVNLFMQGGKIVTRQETENPQIFTTNALRRIKTEIIINPDSNNNASGEVIFDDGYEPDVIENKNFLHLKISMFYDMILFNIKNNFKDSRNYNYEDIKISKLVLFRAEYLKKVDYMQVKLRNGEYEYVNVDEQSDSDIANGRISFDLGKTDLRFDEIESLVIISDKSENKRMQIEMLE